MEQDVYVIKSPEQAKVLANKLRMEILDIFNDWVPRTATQLAVELDLPTAKVHYHVREMMRVGLVEIVQTKEKGGVLEKYYLPIAKEIIIRLEREELDKDNATNPVIKRWFDDYRNAHLESLAATQEAGMVIRNAYSLTPDELKEFRQEWEQLRKKWDDKYNKRDKNGTSTYTVLMAMHRKK